MLHFRNLIHWLFSPENVWAFIFCLIVILLFIATADSSPLWIYQGF